MNYVIYIVPSVNLDQKLKKQTDKKSGKVNYEWELTPKSITNISLLFEEKGKGVTVVNNWLVYLKSYKYRKEVNTQAQALLHYFVFLNEINAKWYEMPILERDRPTYQFKQHLINAVKGRLIARTTANNYMGYVVSFYKFYLSNGYDFRYPPFKLEKIRVNNVNNYSNNGNGYIYKDSTDVRLNLPKDSNMYKAPKKLIPLSKREWELTNKIIYDNNLESKINIPYEIRLIILLSRHTGLRRQELVTFRSKFIIKPTSDQLKKKYLIYTDGIYLSPEYGVETKGLVARYIEIPTWLMLELHTYINTVRYINRRKKFESKNGSCIDNPPLFITNVGGYYSGNTLNARWGEIRNEIKKTNPLFKHKFHNLRSTYAVSRLKEMMDNGIKESDALDYIQSVLGHTLRETLFLYLSFSKDKIDIGNVYEQSLNVILEGGI